MRWWMSLSNSFAEVVMIAHVGIEFPSESFHMDHILTKANGSLDRMATRFGRIGQRTLALRSEAGC